MGEYKTQYERYYRNLSKGSRARGTSVNGNSYGAYYGNGKTKNKSVIQRYVTKFIFQLVGSIILLIIFLCIKYVPISGAEDTYEVTKNELSKNYDLTEIFTSIDIKNIDISDIDIDGCKEAVLDYVDELRSTVTGEEKIKDVIKKQYELPVDGEYKELEGKNKGLAIYTENDADVIASFKGTVRQIKDNNGKHVIIDHENGVETYYGLLSDVSVEEGDIIEKGQVIGKVGTLDADEEQCGIIYKIIYMGDEKKPLELMNFPSLESI